MHARKSIWTYLLIFLIFFQGVSGLFGGLGLITDPSGEQLQMPLTFLEGTPFSNYIIPGIILFLILGCFPVLVGFGLFRQPDWEWAEQLNVYRDQHWAWTFSLYTAIALIIWIDVQIMMIGYGHFIQSFYAFLGAGILIVALLPPVKRNYARSPREEDE